MAGMIADRQVDQASIEAWLMDAEIELEQLERFAQVVALRAAKRRQGIRKIVARVSGLDPEPPASNVVEFRQRKAA